MSRREIVHGATVDIDSYKMYHKTGDWNKDAMKNT